MLHRPDPAPGFALARSPDDVPTPLAIAVATFCRRAGCAASPEAVRLALARLAPTEDGAMQALARGEPPARPLGPEAVIDVLRGLPADEAAEREAAGYYLAMARAPRVPAPAAVAVEPSAAPLPSSAPRAGRDAQRQALLAALGEARGDLRQAAAQLGLSDDVLQAQLRKHALVRQAGAIAKSAATRAKPPTVRAGGVRAERVRPLAAVPPPLPKLTAERPPRGRIVLGIRHTRALNELHKREAKPELRAILQSYKGNRRQLLGHVNRVFKSSRGPLDDADLDALLDRHGLRAEADKLERDNLRFAFAEARGDLGEAAKRLKLAPDALRAYLQARGLWDEAERLRDRYRRELFGRPLSEQIQNLLKRARYVRALGAYPNLERHVRDEVSRNWKVARTAAPSERLAKLAKRLSVEASTAGELVKRFKLT